MHWSQLELYNLLQFLCAGNPCVAQPPPSGAHSWISSVLPLLLLGSGKCCFRVACSYDVIQVWQKKQLCLFQLSIRLPSILTYLSENLKITFFFLFIFSQQVPPLAFSTSPTQNKWERIFFAFLLLSSIKNITSPQTYWSHSLAWTMRQLPFQPLCWLFFFKNTFLMHQACTCPRMKHCTPSPLWLTHRHSNQHAPSAYCNISIKATAFSSSGICRDWDLMTSNPLKTNTFT